MVVLATGPRPATIYLCVNIFAFASREALEVAHLTFELSIVSLIPYPTINCCIGTLQTRCCITKYAITQMDINLVEVKDLTVSFTKTR